MLIIQINDKLNLPISDTLLIYNLGSKIKFVLEELKKKIYP